MNYSTVYVGMDVHKETFSLSCYTNEKEKAEYTQKVEGHYSKVVNYIEAMRFHYGSNARFVCGYEAGCLGYSLYRDLTAHGVVCVILAPTTMPSVTGKKRIKTDKRDAEHIARCLAHCDYSPVNIPTVRDEQVKDYIRMRDDHKLSLKKVKQEINAFCLRHGCHYDGTRTKWTQAHVLWLRKIKLEGLDRDILDEYLLTYDYLSRRIEELDRNIERIAEEKEYREKVARLTCIKGIKTHTALSLIVETGDFRRFADASHYAAYLGLVPGESSSGNTQNRLGITKAGNCHLRELLTECAQCYKRGRAAFKSKPLAARQKGNPPRVIAYADKANERLMRKYHRMVLKNGKKPNVATTAISRELACFIWGMMTESFD